MLASSIDFIYATLGVLGAVAVFAVLAVMTLRERVSRIEEWIRQQERKNGR